eukprot:4406617-Prymnesium_polylepis.1
MQISSSTLRRCETVPMRTSELDDQRVANCVMPQPTTRISICFRRNSSFCASGRSTIHASASVMVATRCRCHAANSSLACAYLSTTASSADCARSARTFSLCPSCSASAARPALRASAAWRRAVSTSDSCIRSQRPR